MRKVAIPALLLLVLPAGAWADRHKAGVGGGFSYAQASNLTGVQLSFEGTIWGQEGDPPRAGAKYSSWLSLALETNLVNGEHDGDNLGQATVLAGARYTWVTSEKTNLFVQGLLGQAWDLQKGVASGAGSIGGGLDWLPVGPSWAIRLRGDGYWTNARDKLQAQVSVAFVLFLE